MSTAWYTKPYPKGGAVGPAHLPRDLKPPSKNGNVRMHGDDVLAMKRTVCKAQRWGEWEPTNWDTNYYEEFAMGRGTGKLPDTGVRGFQRQEGLTQTGIINDTTYQHMRRALIPTGTNAGRHILDTEAIRLIKAALWEFSDTKKIADIRAAIVDYCLRCEAHEQIHHYSQDRPVNGIGLAPEISQIEDCSGYVIKAYYWAKKITGLLVPDPSGYRYTGYGNTWDDLDGHPQVTSGNYLIGDLAHYNGHVTLCRRAGTASTSVWSSMGSERGPVAEPLFYRGDFIKVVRPTLLVT